MDGGEREGWRIEVVEVGVDRQRRRRGDEMIYLFKKKEQLYTSR